MVARSRSLSLDELLHSLSEAVSRVNNTGEAQMLTDDGEVRAVLLSATLYQQMLDAYWLRHDVENIRESMVEIEAGKTMTLDDAHALVRSELQAGRQRGG